MPSGDLEGEGLRVGQGHAEDQWSLDDTCLQNVDVLLEKRCCTGEDERSTGKTKCVLFATDGTPDGMSSFSTPFVVQPKKNIRILWGYFGILKCLAVLPCF